MKEVDFMLGYSADDAKPRSNAYFQWGLSRTSFLTLLSDW
jgi:hypothetical protein